MVRIETERLILREFRKDDVSAAHRYASNPNVVKYMVWGPNTFEESERFIQRKLQEQITQPRMNYSLAITLDNNLIGGCGLTIRNLKAGEAELGYCLDEPYWGKGIGTEVASALIHYGFSNLELHRIFALCDSRNIGSYMVMKKNGMLKEGLFRENKLIRGTYRDTLVYSIL